MLSVVCATELMARRTYWTVFESGCLHIASTVSVCFHLIPGLVERRYPLPYETRGAENPRDMFCYSYRHARRTCEDNEEAAVECILLPAHRQSGGV